MSIISWVTFLEINLIPWPVTSGSANMGGLRVKLHLWLHGSHFQLPPNTALSLHVCVCVCVYVWEGSRSRMQHSPTSSWFNGTSSMEKWDLMSYVKQQEGEKISNSQWMVVNWLHTVCREKFELELALMQERCGKHF